AGRQDSCRGADLRRFHFCHLPFAFCHLICFCFSPPTRKPMDKFLIEGGRPLEGRVTISGAKNAALPAMAAALLTDQRVVLHNVPRVRDIGTLRMLLEELGVDSSAEREGHGHRVEIQARQLEDPLAPYELVKQMRASVLVLGPLLARA